MYYILLESYKDNLFNKLHYVRLIFDSFKVKSEKPKVNQVVPYNIALGSKTPVQIYYQDKGKALREIIL